MSGVSVSWTSREPSVAGVGSAGLVTAARNGTATISATAGNAEGTATVTVEQRPAEVRVTPAADTLYAIDDTVRLSAEVLDANGHAVADAEVTWASGDDLVVTVSGGGLATAVGPGSVSVTATAADVFGSAEVSVRQRPVEVRVSPPTDTVIALADTVRLSAEARDANGHTVANREFTWASGDESVVAVDATGLVTAVGWGSAIVTATTGEVSGSAEVVVRQRPVEIRVSPAGDTLVSLGDTVRLAAEALDGAGNVIAGAEFTWAAAADSIVAVDSTGLVTAVANGSSAVTATFGGTTGNAAVTVAQVPVAIRLGLPRDSLLTGDTVRLTAELTDANGYALEEGEFAWSSADVSVATVDGNGLVWAVAPGSAEMRVVEVVTGFALSFTVHVLDIRGELVELFEALNGEYWTHKDNWGTDAPLDEWYGITTDEYGGVIKLELSNNGLWGEIPPGIGRLEKLEVLDLSQNFVLHLSQDSFSPATTLSRAAAPQDARGDGGWREMTAGDPGEWREWSTDLSDVGVPAIQPPVATDQCPYGGRPSRGVRGSIPLELATLSNLRVLNLGYNGLTGPIPPELGNLERLEVLSLAWNSYLTGPIPPELGRLGKLKVLNLCENRLGDAEPGGWVFPPELGDLENLEVMILGRNRHLSGAIPPDVVKLRNLRVLDLSVSHLTGEIPPGIGQLESLEVLELWGNELSGSIPASLGALRSITVLDLDGNELSDSIPASLGALRSIKVLDLSRNELSGSIPASLGDLTSLQVLKLNGLRLSGEIPTELSKLENLTVLELAGNARWVGGVLVGGLTGGIPPLPDQLEELVLSGNSLTGPIPPELGDLQNLLHLRLAGTHLSGPIPPELGNLRNLVELVVANAQLTGPIPPELGDLSDLAYLALSQNQLTGPIPPELGNLTNLESLGLGGNQLTGPIPPELGNLREVWQLHLGQNLLSGPIPPELGSLPNLSNLVLRVNELTGPIPPELGSLPNLASLSLGENELIDPIPPELGNLSELWLLSVRDNQLTGPLPNKLAIGTLRYLDVARTELTGPIPREFIAVPLDWFYWFATDLCAPGDEEFQDWLDSIDNNSGAGNCSSGGSLGAAADLYEADLRTRAVPRRLR